MRIAALPFLATVALVFLLVLDPGESRSEKGTSVSHVCSPKTENRLLVDPVIQREAAEETVPEVPRVEHSEAHANCRITPRPDNNDWSALFRAIGEETDAHRCRWLVFNLVNRHGVNEEAAALLMERLRMAEDPDLLGVLVWALSRVRSAEAVALLEEIVANTEFESVQLEGVNSLGSIGTEAAGTALGNILHSGAGDSVRMRSATLLGLVWIDDSAAVASLAKAAGTDTSAAVRIASIQSLGSSTGTEAQAALGEIVEGGATQGERILASEQLEEIQAVSSGAADVSESFRETEHPTTSTSTFLE